LALLGLDQSDESSVDAARSMWEQAYTAWAGLRDSSMYSMFAQSYEIWTDNLRSGSPDAKTAMEEGAKWLDAARGFAGKAAEGERLEKLAQQQLDYMKRTGNVTAEGQKVVDQIAAQYKQATGKPLAVDYGTFAVVSGSGAGTVTPGPLIVGLGLAGVAAWLLFRD
jgi:hypothetical protein